MSFAGRTDPFLLAARAAVFLRFRLTSRDTTIQPIATTINRTAATVSKGSLASSSRGCVCSAEVVIWRTRYPAAAKIGRMDELLAKRKVLEETLAGYRAVVVAFSGGVDSAFLTAVAHEVLGPTALAVTAVSPSLSRRELKAAEDLARGYGWNHRLVETHEVERPEYARNAPDRCYWCKHELFEVLAPIAAEAGAEIAVGTNADDLGDHRPGLRAARERDVRSPLVDAGIGKPDVRALAARMGLPVSDKPASPCLASRFAYGVEVTPERLRRVDAAEEIVRALGFEVLRVRDHGDLARIEVPAEDLPRAAAARAELHRELAGLGFRFVTLDLGGFRSGSLNAVLGGPKIVRPE